MTDFADLVAAGKALVAADKIEEATTVFTVALKAMNWEEDEDGTLTTQDKFGLWSVACYLVDRAYGGPEEGGWWYDTGYPGKPRDNDPALATKYFENKQDAYAYRDQMEKALEPYNEGRRPISSVISEGIWRVCVEEGPPHEWPVGRPHYC